MHVKYILDPPFFLASNIVSKAVSAINLKQKAFDAIEIIIPKAYKKFSDVFSNDKANILSKHEPDNYAIDLINNKQPSYGSVYNFLKVKLTVLRQYIDKHLANQFIQSFKSLAGAPIFFVKKFSGGLRLCIDYQDLNNITIKNWYPFPLIGKSLDQLSKAKRFTQLDFTSTYHCLHIKKGDKWKTAFCTQYSYFKYQVLPFGFFNAFAMFQAYINKTLAEKLDIFCIVYLDDILIYSENAKDHEDNVK